MLTQFFQLTIRICRVPTFRIKFDMTFSIQYQSSLTIFLWIRACFQSCHLQIFPTTLLFMSLQFKILLFNHKIIEFHHLVLLCVGQGFWFFDTYYGSIEQNTIFLSTSKVEIQARVVFSFANSTQGHLFFFVQVSCPDTCILTVEYPRLCRYPFPTRP